MKEPMLIKYLWVAGLLATLFTACSEEQAELLPDAALPVTLTASTGSMLQTRANDHGGEDVQDGTFYLSYNTKAADGAGLDYTWGPCVFTNSVGRVYPLTSFMLEWKDMPSLQSYSFMLDNVGYNHDIVEKEYDSKTMATTFTVVDVDLASDDERIAAYSAAVDNGNNKNDIVWGIITDVAYGKGFHICMTHRMARVSVSLTDEQGLLKGQNVTVKITNVVAAPARFRRLDGEVVLSENPVYEAVTLLDNAPLTESGYNVYKTPAFILPPQRLRTASGERPCLEVTVGKGDEQKTFSGVLPDGMVYDSGYAATLEFKQGVHLELQVKQLVQKDENLEILFLPAMVHNWDYKGLLMHNSNSNGVYTQEDLQNALDTFNKFCVARGRYELEKDESLLNKAIEFMDELEKYGILYYGAEDGFRNPQNLRSFRLVLWTNIPELPDRGFKSPSEGPYRKTNPTLNVSDNGYTVGTISGTTNIRTALKDKNYSDWSDIEI